MPNGIFQPRRTIRPQLATVRAEPTPTVGKARSGRALPDTLTPRHLQIVALAADGLTDAQIATRLRATRPTVSCQLMEARSRMGAANRAHLVAKAIRLGLIP